MDTIINLLRQNARLSYKELSDMTGLTESDVAERVREYERGGAIAGYTAVVSGDIADKEIVTAFIEVKVTPKAARGFDDIAEIIMSFDEVESLTLMSGAFDLAVTISGTNYKEIALFVAQRLSTIEGVVSTATHFYLKRYKEKGFILSGEKTDERGYVSP
jgi:DNA-binding Lrp family transcriptional regulator